MVLEQLNMFVSIALQIHHEEGAIVLHRPQGEMGWRADEQDWQNDTKRPGEEGE